MRSRPFVSRRLLATLASPYELSAADKQLAHQLLSDADPYVRYLGAKVIQHADLEHWSSEAFQAMHEIIAKHDDRDLVTKACYLLQTQPNSRATEAAAEAALAIQQRSDLDNELLNLQAQVLRFIAKSGKPSDAAVEKLKLVLHETYKTKPNQGRRQRGTNMGEGGGMMDEGMMMGKMYGGEDDMMGSEMDMMMNMMESSQADDSSQLTVRVLWDA